MTAPGPDVPTRTRLGLGLVLAAIAFGGLGALAARWAATRGPAIDPPPATASFRIVAIGEKVPALTLPDLRTGELRAVAPPGRVRLLNYWASWCGPCREEMPLLQRFADDQGANGVEVVGIALDDAGDARTFLQAIGVRFPQFREAPATGDSSEVFGNSRGILPYSVLIGADGTLLATRYGEFTDRAELDAWVQPR